MKITIEVDNKDIPRWLVQPNGDINSDDLVELTLGCALNSHHEKAMQAGTSDSEYPEDIRAQVIEHHVNCASFLKKLQERITIEHNDKRWSNHETDC